tara:strand:- start:2945 stop:3844 length:900 start_codon:yes stop_codon:yes gene_type:complete
MKKLTLHLGLPKTGTTSLQDHYFPQVGGDIDYVGKVNGERLTHPILASMRNYLDCGEKSLEGNLSRLKTNIESHAFDNILISDEMFVVSSNGVSWEEKLRRLSRIPAQCEEISIEKVIVVFRNPLDAVYSFYVETFQLNKKAYRSCLDFVKNSDQAKIYNYKYLSSVLFELFDSKVVSWRSYEHAIESGGLWSILEDEGFQISVPTEDKWSNTKKRVGDSYISNPFTLENYLVGWPLVRAAKQHLPRSSVSFLRSLLSKVRLSRGKVVAKPSPAEALEITDILLRDIKQCPFISSEEFF